MRGEVLSSFIAADKLCVQNEQLRNNLNHHMVVQLLTVIYNNILFMKC